MGRPFATDSCELLLPLFHLPALLHCLSHLVNTLVSNKGVQSTVQCGDSLALHTCQLLSSFVDMMQGAAQHLTAKQHTCQNGKAHIDFIM